ncbi:MAG: aminopeptidase [Rhodothermaceae bacterium]|nr:aminopeptidase [Rhodothermaceae bacterium]
MIGIRILAIAFLLSLNSAAIAQTIDIYSRPFQAERTRTYDVLHYRVHLIFDEDTKSFSGSNTITMTPLSDTFTELSLDAETFVVDSVHNAAGEILSFFQEPHYLQVRLSRTYAYMDTLWFTVYYHASNVDIDSEAYGMSASYDLGIDFKDETDENPRLINTLSFPEGARHWMPSYDHPNDRASHETLLTVRPEYKALSNGRLVSVTEEENGLMTWHWHQELPHPSYLYVAVAGPYVILEDSLRQIPVNYWVYPKDVDDAMRSFERTPEILEFMEELYGVPYPWTKFDQITIPGIGGGAESTTATVLGHVTIHDEHAEQDYPSDWLVAHEAAHHWFGNLVSYRDWSQTWISESFATWSEYAWACHAHGSDECSVNLQGKKDAYFREANDRYRRPVVFEHWQYPNQNFDRHTYQKGAVILEMLRGILGPANFKRSIQRFLNDHAFQPVHTYDLITAIKDATGQNMEWFFDQWIYSAGHPEITVTQNWDTLGTLTLTVEQSQDMVSPFVYRIPVNIRIHADSEVQEERIWLSERTNTFEFQIDGRPRFVRFDADGTLLADWSFKKDVADLQYQLVQDDAAGRRRAALDLEAHVAQTEVRTGLSDCAASDPFWNVRRTCLDVLSRSIADSDIGLFSESIQDPHSRVRAAAVRGLGDLGSEKYSDLLIEFYRNDTSYFARAEALRSLGKIGDPMIVQFLEEAAQDSSPRNVIRLAAEWALDQFD